MHQPPAVAEHPEASYFTMLLRVLTSAEPLRGRLIVLGEGASLEGLHDLLRDVDTARMDTPLTVSYFVNGRRIVADWDEVGQGLIRRATGLLKESDFLMSYDKGSVCAKIEGARRIRIKYSTFLIRPPSKAVEYEGEIIVDPPEIK